VRNFGYWRDGLFRLSCVLYAVNRWLVKPHVHSPFLRGHFNDLLLIPCALPLVLLFQRWLRLRTHDEAPTAGEIAFHVVIWSILFEAIGPHIMRGVTGDPWDALDYAVGGLVAWCWWNRRQLFRRRAHEL
jgi:hypothetical protein